MRIFDRKHYLSLAIDQSSYGRHDGEDYHHHSHIFIRSWSNSRFEADSFSLNESAYDVFWQYRSHPQGRPKEYRIKKILDDFNFSRVHHMMKAVGWTWHGNNYPPMPDEMRTTAERLLSEVFDQDNNGSISTGGFRATRSPEGILNLEFVGEEREE